MCLYRYTVYHRNNDNVHNLFQVIEADLKTYDGMVKKLGGEANQLIRADKPGTRDVAEKQVCVLSHI